MPFNLPRSPFWPGIPVNRIQKFITKIDYYEDRAHGYENKD
jgi:hypothetical protein